MSNIGPEKKRFIVRPEKLPIPDRPVPAEPTPQREPEQTPAKEPTHVNP